LIGNRTCLLAVAEAKIDLRASARRLRGRRFKGSPVADDLIEPLPLPLILPRTEFGD
jgi:hypothetical protein